ncbi:MAG TPA: methyltransferase domain-containing protein [Methylomirabilota bacterium]|nr:methyltransferase domain-containing protein [Methylomirabilota bacterium]
MSETPPPGVSDPAFWRARYRDGSDGWELGGPNPVLVTHLARRGLPGSAARIAVPGCGRGHDARLLAEQGSAVWGFDWAPEALAAARRLAAGAGDAVTFEERDIFRLAGTHDEGSTAYLAFFDGIWEYTCFCAIDPARRAEYVNVLAAILVPGGWLLADFFPLRDGDGGPPYPVSRDEIRRLLAPHFVVVDEYVPGASAPGREGLEWMVTARRRVSRA